MIRCADYLLIFSKGIPLAAASGSSVPHLSFSASAVTFLWSAPGVVPCFHISLSSWTLCKGLLVFSERAREHRGGGWVLLKRSYFVFPPGMPPLTANFALVSIFNGKGKLT